jgi:branched-chain amino acid transport system permease protein
VISSYRRAGVLGATLLALLVLPIFFAAIGESYLTSLFTRIFIYALVGVSLDLIIGQAGLVSFGHAAFFGMGAYVCGIFAHHHNYKSAVLGIFAGTNNALISWPVSIIACGILGLAIGLISLRTKGVYFIMITLALAQMVYFLVISVPQYGGEDGFGLWGRNQLPGLDLDNDVQFYYVCLVVFSVYLLAAIKVTQSSFGLIIKGAKFNHQRLVSLGIQPFRYQLLIFVFSAAGAGLAGALMVNLTQYVSPDYLHWSLSGKFLVIVILGGIGSLYGGFYGALILLGLEEILANYTEHWQMVIGVILILMVLKSRQGLYNSLTGKHPG